MDDERAVPQGGGGERPVPPLIELNHRIVEAFNRGGMEAAAEYFDPDVELYDPDMPGGTPMRGREAVIDLFVQQLEAFDTMQVRELEMYVVGDRVLSLVHTEGAGEGTLGRMRVGFHDAHVTTFREGKAVYWRIFHDPREAFEEVGLDPDDPGEPFRFVL